MKKGFTLLELLITIAILSIISALTLWHWSGYKGREALSKDKMGIMAFMEEARSLSVASKNNSEFGVHIASSTITLFEGSSYSAGAPENINYSMNSAVEIYSINLSNGGEDIVFNRLSGENSDFGNIILRLYNDSNASTTITILKSGVVQ